jgi:hypothetical protein
MTHCEARMPEERMCKHECPMDECTLCECFANVCDDFIYEVATINSVINAAGDWKEKL